MRRLGSNYQKRFLGAVTTTTTKKDTKKQEVVVVGGGIIGMTTAYSLARSGHIVTLIEKLDDVTQFCSNGNAGIIGHNLYSTQSNSSKIDKRSSQGLSFSTIFGSVLHHILPQNMTKHSRYFNRNTVFFVDPKFFFDRESIKWGLLYMKHKTIDTWNKSIETNGNARAKWADYCFDEWNELLCTKNDPTLNKSIDLHDFKVYMGEYNIFLNDMDNYEHLKDVQSILDNFGVSIISNTSQHVLESKQSVSDTVTHKIHVKSQLPNTDLKYSYGVVTSVPKTIVADCGKFGKVLKHACEGVGVRFQCASEITKVIVNKNSKITGVSVNHRSPEMNSLTALDTVIPCDSVVLCAGIKTNDILQNKIYTSNGLNNDNKLINNLPYMPLTPLQGISMTIKCNDDYVYPYSNGAQAMLPGRWCVSRLDDKIIRIAAFGYLRRLKDVMNQSKHQTNDSCKDMKLTKFEKKLVDLMEKTAEKYILPLYGIKVDSEEWENRRFWTNWRPMTPDRLPVITKINDIDGLFINAGHGSSGWIFSAGSAKLITNIINKEEMTEDEESFSQMLSLKRFNIRRNKKRSNGGIFLPLL